MALRKSCEQLKHVQANHSKLVCCSNNQPIPAGLLLESIAALCLLVSCNLANRPQVTCQPQQYLCFLPPSNLWLGWMPTPADFPVLKFKEKQSLSGLVRCCFLCYVWRQTRIEHLSPDPSTTNTCIMPIGSGAATCKPSRRRCLWASETQETYGFST